VKVNDADRAAPRGGRGRRRAREWRRGRQAADARSRTGPPPAAQAAGSRSGKGRTGAGGCVDRRSRHRLAARARMAAAGWPRPLGDQGVRPERPHREDRHRGGARRRRCLRGSPPRRQAAAAPRVAGARTRGGLVLRARDRSAAQAGAAVDDAPRDRAPPHGEQAAGPAFLSHGGLRDRQAARWPRGAQRQERREGARRVQALGQRLHHQGRRGGAAQVPAANASFSDDGLLFWENVDISVAVAIPGGLITPIIRNADQGPGRRSRTR
jgi:hypothetical protein